VTLDGHLGDVGAAHGVGQRRPPLPDLADEDVEDMVAIAADHDGLVNRRDDLGPGSRISSDHGDIRAGGG
jgi:hypothetical protein